MRAVIHIGSPKTGTSALQAALCDSKEVLHTAGYLYPETGRRIGGKSQTRQVGLRIAFEPPETRPSGMMDSLGVKSAEQRRQYREDFQQHLKDELRQAENMNNVIFSDEALFSFSNPRMIGGLSEYFQKTFDETRILIFIKDPVRYIAGSYSQHVKMGSTKRWPELMQDRMKNPIYERAIKLWVDAFGRDRVHVAVQTSDIISQFKAAADLPVDLLPSNRGRNASLSSIGLPTMRHLNKLFAEAGLPRPGFVRKAFEKAATRTTAWSPPREDAEAIAAWFEPERERLVDLVDFSDADILKMRSWSETASEHPSAETAMREEELEQFGDLIFEILRKTDQQANTGKRRPAAKK